MPRGIFQQCVAVLFESAPDLAAVEAALPRRRVRARRAAEPDARWVGGFPELVLVYREDLGGHVIADVVDRPWPDAMGDPQEDPDLFAAWGLGSFGPGAFPGNLARAVQQAVEWPAGADDAAARHRAFVRVRLTYFAGPDAPVVPEGADSLDELLFVTDVARALLDLPGALAFWNPNAELLLDAEGLDGRLASARESGLPPVDAFAHVRLARAPEAPEHAVMDTVGLDQLGLPDQEACFPLAEVDPDAVAGFLYDLAAYLVKEGEVIADGDTVEGPGGVWRALVVEGGGLVPPPRRTLRWLPEAYDVSRALGEEPG